MDARKKITRYLVCHDCGTHFNRVKSLKEIAEDKPIVCPNCKSRNLGFE